MVRPTETEKRMVVARAWARRGRELVIRGHRVSVLQMKRALETDGGDVGCTTR